MDHSELEPIFIFLSGRLQHPPPIWEYFNNLNSDEVRIKFSLPKNIQFKTPHVIRILACQWNNPASGHDAFSIETNFVQPIIVNDTEQCILGYYTHKRTNEYFWVPLANNYIPQYAYINLRFVGYGEKQKFNTNRSLFLYLQVIPQTWINGTTK